MREQQLPLFRIRHCYEGDMSGDRNGMNRGGKAVAAATALKGGCAAVILDLDAEFSVGLRMTLAFDSLALLLEFSGFSRWLLRSVGGRFSDLLNIENILFPTRSQLVLNQVFP